MPNAFPTLLIGIGESLQPFAGAVAALLETYERRMLLIVRVGAVVEGRLIDAQGGVVVSEAEAGRDAPPLLSAALAQWLEEVVTEHNAEAVRQQGIHVGVPEGQLFARVALVCDGESPAEELRDALTALRAAAEQLRQNLPVRLTCVALTAGSERAILGFPLDEWLSACRSERLEPVNVVLLDRFRSDGSSLGQEDVRRVLPFLLFAALLPTERDEHWLFLPPISPLQRGGEGEMPFIQHTFGVGAMVVPLPAIEDALSHALVADLLPLLQAQPDSTPDRFLVPFRLDDAFAEATVWESLLVGVPADTTPTEMDAFNVRLHEGKVRLELDSLHWQHWAERIADYDTKLGKVEAQGWVERMRQNGRAQARALVQHLQQTLDAAVREGQGCYALAEQAIARVRDILNSWRCDDARVGVPDPNLTAARQSMETALQQMPNGWAVAARCFLLMLVEAYAAFALARGFMGSRVHEFMSQWLGDDVSRFAFIPVIIGVLLMALTAWRGVTLWEDAKRRVERARDDYLAAIAGKYAAVVRSEGVLLLRELKQHLLAQLSHREEQLKRLNQRTDEVATQARQKTESFAPPRSPLIRSIVNNWQELEPVARDLWGNRELKSLLQAMLGGVPVTTFEQFCRRTAARPSTPEIKEVREGESMGQWVNEPVPLDPFLSDCAAAAHRVLREKLMSADLRTLGYYLRLRFKKDEDKEEWLAQQVGELHAQATRLLWSQLKGTRRTFQLLPMDEENLRDAAPTWHPELAEPLPVMGILGTLCQQEV